MDASTNIQYLKGVGEKRAGLYNKLGVFSVGDLLYHFPRDYIDLSAPYTIAAAPSDELRPVAVRALLTFKSAEQRIRAKLSVFKLTAEDETGILAITVFNAGWTVGSLKTGEEYIFYGRIGDENLHGRREMSSPEFFPVPRGHAILPVYPQTAGLNSRAIRKQLDQALLECPLPPESLPEVIRRQYGLPNLETALRQVHFPDTLAAAHRARDRFIFEELLTLAIALSEMRGENSRLRVDPMPDVDLGPFFSSLPYSPTGAQYRCIGEAAADMGGDAPMSRLLQGDVGSGKTLVAAACCYYAIKNKRQAAVMVPTEILAEQHFVTMQRLLSPHGAHIELLTGATKLSEKRRVLAGLADGTVNLVVGTHALLSENVEFLRLGLVVTDEQHRFGVAQRARLAQKSEGVHVLVMSATPIPRTLSLIIYGDLKLSVLDESPPGRKPVETLLISGAKRQRAIGFIRDKLDAGGQAYIVCPLIERGESDENLRPAVEYAERLAGSELRGYRLGLLHGRMKAKDKDDAMRRFKSGETQALVSTTVVEVGVDVPNATIIMIENAERFGLSQLHQLRGRVGRGEGQSWCILVSDARSPTTRERLKSLRDNRDGFAIAEQDLKLRGPGDFFGFRQHGLPTLRVADLADDIEVLKIAQECAASILADDPGLEKPEHLQLKARASHMLSSVGDRPN